MNPYLASLAGGTLIGLSAVIFMIFNGRVAGISGIVGRLAQGSNFAVNAAFVAGLLAGPAVYLAAFGAWPAIHVKSSLPLVVLAGLLVGFGSRMGSGCTSGHGVVGLARFSPRSIVAVATFVLAGVLAVALLRRVGL